MRCKDMASEAEESRTICPERCLAILVRSVAITSATTSLVARATTRRSLSCLSRPASVAKAAQREYCLVPLD